MRNASLWIALITTGVQVLAACSGGSETGSGGAGATTSSGSGTTGSGGMTSSGSMSGSGGMTSASSTAGTGGATGTGGTGGTTATMAGSGGAGGGSPFGYCAKACTAPIDCCPPGSPNCPGPQYPNNPICMDGACRPPECATTGDCTAVNPKLDCISLGGTESCALACMVDGDCMTPLTCSGMDDNGKKFCLASGGGGCTTNQDCTGAGICKNGVCGCESDADCTDPTFPKCAQ